MYDALWGLWPWVGAAAGRSRFVKGSSGPLWCGRPSAAKHALCGEGRALRREAPPCPFASRCRLVRDDIWVRVLGPLGVAAPWRSRKRSRVTVHVPCRGAQSVEAAFRAEAHSWWRTVLRAEAHGRWKARVSSRGSSFRREDVPLGGEYRGPAAAPLCRLGLPRSACTAVPVHVRSPAGFQLERSTALVRGGYACCSFRRRCPQRGSVSRERLAELHGSLCNPRQARCSPRFAAPWRRLLRFAMAADPGRLRDSTGSGAGPANSWPRTGRRMRPLGSTTPFGGPLRFVRCAWGRG